MLNSYWGAGQDQMQTAWVWDWVGSPTYTGQRRKCQGSVIPFRAVLYKETLALGLGEILRGDPMEVCPSEPDFLIINATGELYLGTILVKKEKKEAGKRRWTRTSDVLSCEVQLAPEHLSPPLILIGDLKWDKVHEIYKQPKTLKT